jgi:hypothetical protein
MCVAVVVAAATALASAAGPAPARDGIVLTARVSFVPDPEDPRHPLGMRGWGARIAVRATWSSDLPCAPALLEEAVRTSFNRKTLRRDTLTEGIALDRTGSGHFIREVWEQAGAKIRFGGRLLCADGTPLPAASLRLHTRIPLHSCENGPLPVTEVHSRVEVQTGVGRTARGAT